MEVMDSGRWFNVESVPLSYTFPPEERPGKSPVPVSNTVPVIDLGKTTGDDGNDTVWEMMRAGEEFGFFQVINHGISEEILSDAIGVMKEFFSMRLEEKAIGVAGRKGWIYTSSTDYSKNGVHLWRENMKHPCSSTILNLKECMPENPTSYREVMGAYLEEIRKLSHRILDMICEGLGLEAGYLGGIGQVQLLSANNYPPCPDPSSTLGILRHRDPSLITIVLQEGGAMGGLQVFKDGDWIGVAPLPNAFVVNIGNQLEIISNGKLQSAEHRAVTNSTEERISIATFVNPCPDSIIEPAKVLINEFNPPLYKPFLYKELVQVSKAFGPDTEAIQKCI